MSRRSKLLMALAAVLVAALVVVRFVGEGPTCPVSLEAVESGEPVLVPATDLVPEGTVGDERRPVVEAVGVIGEVVSGRFFGADFPALVPLGDALGVGARR